MKPFKSEFSTGAWSHAILRDYEAEMKFAPQTDAEPLTRWQRVRLKVRLRISAIREGWRVMWSDLRDEI